MALWTPQFQGLVGAAGVSFLLLAVAHHWLLQITGGRLHHLWRYVIGQALILCVYAVWCGAQAGPLTPAWAVVGLLATTAGAGAGTFAGYGVDWIAKNLRAQRWNAGDGEPATPEAGEDRGGDGLPG